MSRGWSIALWCLLAVSLFGNAVALGVALRVAKVAEVTHLGEGYRELPADVRADIRDRLREAGSGVRAALEKLGLARRHLTAAATAEPFDPAAFDVAASEVRAATAELQLLGQDALKSALEARSN